MNKENQLKKKLYLRQGQNRAIFENFFQLSLLLEIIAFFLLCLAIASSRVIQKNPSMAIKENPSKKQLYLPLGQNSPFLKIFFKLLIPSF